MARFAAIPTIDAEGLPDNQVLALNAMKENVELLAGIRGGRADSMRAILKGEIKLQGIDATIAPNIGSKQMTVQGQSYEIRGAQVPSMTDFVRLINDVVEIKQDILAIVIEMAATRQALSALIEQLRR